MSNEENTAEKTKAGKFLKTLGNVGKNILSNIVGGKDPITAILGAVGIGELSQEDANTALKFYQEDLADTQDARKNETARDTSSEAPYISKIIHEVIAILVTTSWIISWWIPVFATVADPKDAVMLILGYLYGRTRPQN